MSLAQKNTYQNFKPDLLFNNGHLLDLAELGGVPSSATEKRDESVLTTKTRKKETRGKARKGFKDGGIFTNRRCVS